MANINHMYQWSLEYFVNFFGKRLHNSLTSPDVYKRVKILIDDITFQFYNNVGKGLLNQHKFVYSF